VFSPLLVVVRVDRPALGLLAERGVEGLIARREDQSAEEPASLLGPVLPVHMDVFPFDRQHTPVADAEHGAPDFLEVDAATPEAPEVPGAVPVAEGAVAAEPTRASRGRGDPDVLHVRMDDPLPGLVDEADVVDVLPSEVAGIIVETEVRVVADRLEHQLHAEGVHRHLGGMDLHREPHAQLPEVVEDRRPHLAEELVRLLHRPLRVREGVDIRPRARASEAGNNVQPHVLGRLRRQLHPFRGPPVQVGRSAIAPDVVRDDVVKSLSRQAADRLTD